MPFKSIYQLINISFDLNIHVCMTLPTRSVVSCKYTKQQYYRLYRILCSTADLKVIYVHILLKIVGNSISNVQINFIFNNLFRS